MGSPFSCLSKQEFSNATRQRRSRKGEGSGRESDSQLSADETKILPNTRLTKPELVSSWRGIIDTGLTFKAAALSTAALFIGGYSVFPIAIVTSSGLCFISTTVHTLTEDDSGALAATSKLFTFLHLIIGTATVASHPFTHPMQLTLGGIACSAIRLGVVGHRHCSAISGVTEMFFAVGCASLGAVCWEGTFFSLHPALMCAGTNALLIGISRQRYGLRGIREERYWTQLDHAFWMSLSAFCVASGAGVAVFHVQEIGVRHLSNIHTISGSLAALSLAGQALIAVFSTTPEEPALRLKGAERIERIKKNRWHRLRGYAFLGVFYISLLDGTALWFRWLHPVTICVATGEVASVLFLFAAAQNGCGRNLSWDGDHHSLPDPYGNSEEPRPSPAGAVEGSPKTSDDTPALAQEASKESPAPPRE